MSDDLDLSVKDQIVGFLAHGSTLLTSVEGFFQGKEKGAVRRVIQSHPELFDVFARGFPKTGAKSLWVRLKREPLPS